MNYIIMKRVRMFPNLIGSWEFEAIIPRIAQYILTVVVVGGLESSLLLYEAWIKFCMS